jgi:three-Cys-motif partner protein
MPLLDLPEFEAVRKGSARLALEVEPPFHRYVLIERATRRASDLTALKAEFPGREIEIINKDANDAIGEICRTTNWRITRGVVFLDPYGLQVSWATLVAISKTESLDAWILFPTGIGLNRLLKKDGNLPQEWEDTLDRFLGMKEWRSEFYTIEETRDLFAGSQAKTIKSASAEKFEKFILARLRTIFPVVMGKGVALTNSKGQTMYLLCFVSANRSPKVKTLAIRLAGWAAKV